MPTVVLFRGKAGSGKTTISTEFAKHSGFSLIRKDDIYDAVAAAIEDHAKRNAISEEAIRNLISSNLKAGRSVVVDNSLSHYELAVHFKAWVEAQGALFKSFLVVCSDEALWKKRFETRKANPKPNQLITDFEKLKAHYQKMDIRGLEGETELDTVLPLDQLLRATQSTLPTC